MAWPRFHQIAHMCIIHVKSRTIIGFQVGLLVQTTYIIPLTITSDQAVSTGRDTSLPTSSMFVGPKDGFWDRVVTLSLQSELFRGLLVRHTRRLTLTVALQSGSKRVDYIELSEDTTANLQTARTPRSTEQVGVPRPDRACTRWE